MRQWQFQEVPHESELPYPEVTSTSGKHKGKIGHLMGRSYSSSVVFVAWGFGVEAKSFPYRDIEYVDINGTAMIEPVTDMSERELKIGDWVTYSVPAGNSSHALEVGEITQISKIGGLTVKRAVRNGSKVVNHYRGDALRRITDADRCLKLPVDTKTLTKWVLLDFEEMGA
jgi:hypothetical protein